MSVWHLAAPVQTHLRLRGAAHHRGADRPVCADPDGDPGLGFLRGPGWAREREVEWYECHRTRFDLAVDTSDGDVEQACTPILEALAAKWGRA